MQNWPKQYLARITGVMLTTALVAAASAQQPSLTVDVNHPLHAVSPTLYGLMTEEINFSYDGGIYAEMVRDRTLGRDWQALAHWTMVSYGKSTVDITEDGHTGPSQAITNSLKVHVTEASDSAPAGVQNDGYWGMAGAPTPLTPDRFTPRATRPIPRLPSRCSMIKPA